MGWDGPDQSPTGILVKCLEGLVRSTSGKELLLTEVAARLKNLAVDATRVIKNIRLGALDKLNTIAILEVCCKFGGIVYAYNIQVPTQCSVGRFTA